MKRFSGSIRGTTAEEVHFSRFQNSTKTAAETTKENEQGKEAEKGREKKRGLITTQKEHKDDYMWLYIWGLGVTAFPYGASMEDIRLKGFSVWGFILPYTATGSAMGYYYPLRLRNG